MNSTTAKPKYTISGGSSYPLGATVKPDGINFSLFSERATQVELLLFEHHDAVEPFQIVSFDPNAHRTFHFWHVFVEGLPAGTHYAYRVNGPTDASQGDRFDSEKVLLDPYAKGNNKTLWNRGKACVPGDNMAASMRCVAIDTDNYDWEGDRPLGRPINESIIYELHVGGFTRSPSSGVKHPGTFAGLREKIPYLQALGITAVELLPIFEFDSTDVLRTVNGQELHNYWGYSTMSYFAPHPTYCVNPETGDHVREFRDLVKALHRAGIEVILDVVFNHTDEGNHQGPTFSFRGIDNRTYYYLVPGNRQYYYDYTGCGNTFNCNHPIGEKLILDCLRYWVKEMHVDGFRFDEGSVLSRGEDGTPLEHPPAIWAIELDEDLAHTKVIAEAWDAAGLYQIGYFPGYRWAEWNGKYRDAIRRFVKGDPGLVGEVASRLAGSADLYQWRGHSPVNSVNFIVAHDGFTLYDLVAYNNKHNEANGEGNNDGINENLSWNCGAEGPTDDRWIEDLRRRQLKNFATILLVSQGTPMLVMGDEVGRTQNGNNNAYCQDNELSWFDWKQVEENQDLLRFWQIAMGRRRHFKELVRSRYFTGAVNNRGVADITWHGTELGQPGWDDPQSRSLAFTLGGFGDDPDVHVMLNMYWDSLSFALPSIPGRQWHRSVDTALPSPQDITPLGKEIPITDSRYLLTARSVVILDAKPV
ncbi:glycogen debranching enzyme GlgX [Rubidibacter lacunae KORDI 51-2]|uniref:Glycogen debranching enzyme GlgX n=1 Tax=Rubidibacter lacunae KORDI 51-2 TaxID=582515 RepID=U5DPQ4_9CHRO|nr:glycogen debranching protein GlgX [Rubidibacter lacunae]ERN42847.1 glycogen debranching enzyme GlgX [Rubidibacter lacunae KORDI 51-2]